MRPPRAPSMRRLAPVAIPIAALLVAVGPARAQEEDDAWTVAPERIELARNAPLFLSADPLELTLAAPFSVIRREDRGEGAERRPAALTLRGAQGDVTLDIHVQTRGNFRREARNCDFPPLWIDLDKDDPGLDGTPFAGENRLKLYVTCRPDRDEYEQYILQEYLVYRTYNLLTDESFRARLARVRYEDTDEPGASFMRWAFLLEHKDRMAARNEAVPVGAPRIHPAALHPTKSALFELFNYMIGMTDWSSVFLHNVEVVRRMDGAVVPVPYDFDWSGIVDARYAVPDPQLGIRSVRQRKFQGFCRDIDWDGVFQEFLDRRDEVLALWNGFEPLDPKRRERAVDFLEDFFERAADPGWRTRILRECTEIPA